VAGQAASISLAVAPFGVAFGVLARQADLNLLETLGFSTIIFTGSAQFAAVGVLGDGGTVVAAVVAGVLLNLRMIAFGVVIAPALAGPRWRRAVSAQLMIDESSAVGSAQDSLEMARFGYLLTGGGVFVVWNLATVAGYSALRGAGDLVETIGIDATIPAVFLALIWPRLADDRQRLVAGLGAVIAFATVPLVPVGVPIIAAAAGVIAMRWPRSAP